MRFIGVSDEPADAGRGIVASSGFAQRHFVAAAIEAALPSAVENRGQHAFTNFRKNRGDIQIALHARREILNVIGSARILQIVEGPAIRKSRGDGNELQWRDLHSFAKTGHARNAAMRGRLHRERTRMLFRQIVAGELTQTEQARVTRNGVKTHAAAQLLEKHVIGMRHRFRQIHVLAAAHLEHSVASNDIFFEGSESDGGLNGGAWNIAVAESNLLIDDGENTAGVGINGYDRAVVAAKPFHGGGANNGIVKGADIGERGVSESRDAAKTRDAMQRSSARSRRGRPRRCDRYTKDCGQENTSQLLHVCSEKIYCPTQIRFVKGCLYPSVWPGSTFITANRSSLRNNCERTEPNCSASLHPVGQKRKAAHLTLFRA